MIIVRLSGGLGNQMFQYAAALRLAHIHDVALKIDTSKLDSHNPLDTPRRYELERFRISADNATSEECKICEGLGKKWLTPVSRILQKCGILPSKSGFHYYRERCFSFDRHFLNLPNNVCLEGFWQSEKYFQVIRASIMNEFSLRDGLTGINVRLAENISASNSVSLHVRRGDYISNPAAARYHGTCDIDYYSRAIDEIKQRVTVPHLFVFSDAPGWAVTNLNLDIPTTFIDHNASSNSCEDLSLMRLCKHNIIANSSFSWWGAWLNENTGKTIIAPAQWFRKSGVDTRDLIPETWLRM